MTDEDGETEEWVANYLVSNRFIEKMFHNETMRCNNIASLVNLISGDDEGFLQIVEHFAGLDEFFMGAMSWEETKRLLRLNE